MSIAENIRKLKSELEPAGVKLVVVSKTQPVEKILEAYEAGQRMFGENQVQELDSKYKLLPADIEWHFIGHLQTNKVKFVSPYISLIQSVDSLKLLQEINKSALKNKRVIDCFLQVNIADEDTKFGMDFEELVVLLRSTEYQEMKNVRITGLMGIATHTEHLKQIKDEFYELKTFFTGLRESFFRGKPEFKEISMGMSDDYKLAVEEKTTIVRVGSGVFGKRKKILHEN